VALKETSIQLGEGLNAHNVAIMIQKVVTWSSVRVAI